KDLKNQMKGNLPRSGLLEPMLPPRRGFAAPVKHPLGVKCTKEIKKKCLNVVFVIAGKQKENVANMNP
ncbi:MAG: hypothetical protein KAJ14_10065, partial [Candidatus Omnitrophica bacterium]|nr:hypothetical protein [Candidatus Omnitrophota bacterium]